MGLFQFLSRLSTLVEGIPEIVKVLPLGMCYAVFLPPLLYSLALTQIYTNKVTSEYKNAFILYIKTFPLTIVATLAVMIPVFFELIPTFVLKHILLLVYILLFFPFAITGAYLFFISRFDMYINKEQFPEVYHKGLYDRETIENKGENA